MAATFSSFFVLFISFFLLLSLKYIYLNLTFSFFLFIHLLFIIYNMISITFDRFFDQSDSASRSDDYLMMFVHHSFIQIQMVMFGLGFFSRYILLIEMNERKKNKIDKYITNNYGLNIYQVVFFCLQMCKTEGD